MSVETFERARREAIRLAEAGHVRDLAVVAIHLITNGWDNGSARCVEVSSHAVEFYRPADSSQGMVIWPEWNEPHRGFYVIDDGVSARPMYVTGWQAETAVEVLYLGTFPLNVGPDGEPRTRPDTGRPVDFSTWMLSARRGYHVKVRREIPALAGQPY